MTDEPTKPAPGPWKAEWYSYPLGDTGDQDGGWSIKDANGKFVEQFDDSDIAEANSRLMAAAPELLEALRRIVDWAECVGGVSQTQRTLYTHIVNAQAVIDRATGKEVEK